MDSDIFIDMARVVVAKYLNDSDIEEMNFEDVKKDTFVVWSSKTLQNNKAMIGTDLKSGYYFEVTHNGDKKEIYLDAYRKEENRSYSIKDNIIIRRD